MKRYISILLAITLCLALAACGSNDTPETTAAPVIATEPLPTETVPETTVPVTTAPSREDPELTAYMASVQEQSDALKTSMAEDPLSQYDLNVKSKELFDLWDGALNYLWAKLEERLPEEEFETLREQQRTWIADKEAAVEAAGADYQGGSLYALIVNTEAADLTEKRVLELYELLK